MGVIAHQNVRLVKIVLQYYQPMRPAKHFNSETLHQLLQTGNNSIVRRRNKKVRKLPIAFGKEANAIVARERRIQMRISPSIGGLACVGLGVLTTLSLSNTLHSQIHLGSEVNPTAEPSQKLPVTILEPAKNDVPGGLERIRERFPDGKVHVERSVVLDNDGNYVNHGDFREFSPKGDLIASGKYVQGIPDGIWFKVCLATDSKMFTHPPFSKFAAPFQSTVSFSKGAMDGVWTIVDKDNRVVSQIELRDGKRQGTSTFYTPSGKILTQAHYSDGVLHGRTLENSMDGRSVRDEIYSNGQRTEVETQYYPNKAIKSVSHYLSAVQKVIEPDNWMTNHMASLKPVGERVLHGVTKTHYENGQQSSESNYDHGQLHGNYASWYPNGEKSVAGKYEHGVQHGSWVWRHPNGMKRAVAEFVDGQISGKVLAWNDQGKAMTHEALKPILRADLISTTRKR